MLRLPVATGGRSTRGGSSHGVQRGRGRAPLPGNVRMASRARPGDVEDARRSATSMRGGLKWARTTARVASLVSDTLRALAAASPTSGPTPRRVQGCASGRTRHSGVPTTPGVGTRMFGMRIRRRGR